LPLCLFVFAFACRHFDLFFVFLVLAFDLFALAFR